MHYGKPLLVRDIPVFKEVLGKYENVIWFTNDLEEKIVQFYKENLEDTKESLALKKCSNWEQSIKSLYEILI